MKIKKYFKLHLILSKLIHPLKMEINLKWSWIFRKYKIHPPAGLTCLAPHLVSALIPCSVSVEFESRWRHGCSLWFGIPVGPGIITRNTILNNIVHNTLHSRFPCSRYKIHMYFKNVWKIHVFLVVPNSAQKKLIEKLRGFCRALHFTLFMGLFNFYRVISCRKFTSENGRYLYVYRYLYREI